MRAMRPPDFERGTALSMADSEDSIETARSDPARPPPSCIHAVTVMLFLLVSIMTIFGRLAPRPDQLDANSVSPSRLHQVAPAQEEEKARDWLSPLVELEPVSKGKSEEEEAEDAARARAEEEARANAWRQCAWRWDGCPCSNELEQQEHVWRLAVEEPESYHVRPGGAVARVMLKPWEYTYRTNLTQREDGHGVLLNVTEKFRGKLSRGGASLHVEWRVYAPEEAVESLKAEEEQDGYREQQREQLLKIRSEMQDIDQRRKSGGAAADRVEDDRRRKRLAELADLLSSQRNSTLLSVTACGVTDHFNGSYTICCRRPLHASLGVNEITIQQWYLDYALFQSNAPKRPLQRHVYRLRWDGRAEEPDGSKPSPQDGQPPHESKNLTSVLPSLPTCTSNLTQLGLEGEWGYSGRRLRWLSPSRQCSNPEVSSDEAGACLSRLRSLHVIGDADLRSFASYASDIAGLRRLTRGLEEVEWETAGGRLSFRQSSGSASLVSELLRLSTSMEGRKLERGDVLVLDSGAGADLESHDLTTLLHEGIPPVLDAIKLLRAKQPHLRIVWVTTYPHPPKHEAAFHSEATAQAVEAMVLPQLSRMGVEVINALNVVRPRAREAAGEGQEYLARDEAVGVVGEVGLEAAHLMLAAVCEAESDQLNDQGNA